MTNPISIEGNQPSLARLTIFSNSHFAGKTVGIGEDNYHLKIILRPIDHQSELHPTASALLGAWNILAVLCGPEPLSHLLHDNDLSHR